MPRADLVRHHTDEALRRYRTRSPDWQRRKAGLTAVRLRALGRAYFEQTGSLLFPIPFEQMLKVLMPLMLAPAPKRPRQKRPRVVS
jgi:hypothetical protein